MATPHTPDYGKSMSDGLAKALGDALGDVAVKDAASRSLGESLGDAFKALKSSVGKAASDGFKPLSDASLAAGVSLGLVARALGGLRDSLATVAGAVGSLAGAALSVGAAFAPLGERVGRALAPLKENVGRAFAQIGSIASEALARVSKTPLGAAVARVGGSAGAAAGGAAAGIGAIAGAAAGAAGAALQLGQALGGLVAAANPGMFERFQIVLSDLQAVVGRALIPVFDVVIQVVRMAADTLTTFVGEIGSAFAVLAKAALPILSVVFEMAGHVGQALGRVFQSLAPAFEALSVGVTAVLQALQPLIDVLIDTVGGLMAGAFGALAGALQAVAPLVVAVTQAVGGIITSAVRWIREMLEWLGVLEAERPGTAPGSSVGAAAKAANIGSVESVLAAAQKSAFSIGTGAEDPARRTASAAESIKATAEKILEKLKTLPIDIAVAIRDGAVDEVGNFFESAAEATGVNTVTRALGLDEDRRVASNPVRDAIEMAHAFYARHGGGGGVVGGDF